MRRYSFVSILFALIVLGAGESACHAADAYEVMKSCVAGDAMDLPCMKKHRAGFEKYVLKQSDYLSLKRAVTESLVAYYERSGDAATPDSRLVRSKLVGLNRATEIGSEVLKSHIHNCTKGPACEEGYYVDVSDEEWQREVQIRTKQYLVSVDATLYQPEIKHLESKLKPESGPGFWNQVLQGMAK